TGDETLDPAERAASIARAGDEGVFLRRRMERPARVGRFVLVFLGAVTASAGIALWITSGSALGVAIGVFGTVLIALGVAQHLLHKRDIKHWPNDVLLWDEGIELVLPNGEVCGATWGDPDFAVELVSRRAPLPAKREYLMLWLSDSKIPPVQLSEAGYERLAKVAAAGGLQITQSRRGARVDAFQVVQIRALPSSGSTDSKTSSGAEV
ncbi:MAG TPA: hypothetical protein VED63_02895, partial [Acidimicrobiales bacterium]|nr:hypothetical protein [Acidimicrobiales bacterium]